jgi:hypothetical protein
MFTDVAIKVYFVHKSKAEIHWHVSQFAKQNVLQHVILSSGRVNRHVDDNELLIIGRSLS